MKVRGVVFACVVLMATVQFGGSAGSEPSDDPAYGVDVACAEVHEAAGAAPRDVIEDCLDPDVYDPAAAIYATDCALVPQTPYEMDSPTLSIHWGAIVVCPDGTTGSVFEGRLYDQAHGRNRDYKSGNGSPLSGGIQAWRNQTPCVRALGLWGEYLSVVEKAAVVGPNGFQTFENYGSPEKFITCG